MKALEGITVLEFASYVSGPYAGMMLSDLGAEVIKIEGPDGGDPFRGWGAADYSATFGSVNRNKKSVVLDLKSDDGLCCRSCACGRRGRADRELPRGHDGSPRSRLRGAQADQSAADLRLGHGLRADRSLRRPRGLRHRRPGDERAFERAHEPREPRADGDIALGSSHRHDGGLRHPRRADGARTDGQRPARRDIAARRDRRVLGRERRALFRDGQDAVARDARPLGPGLCLPRLRRGRASWCIFPRRRSSGAG